MQKFQTVINWVAISSEIGHIFCCALPTLFSVLALLSGLGVIGAVPAEMAFLHDLFHGYEIPVIIGSGAILLVGWVLHFVARRMDCSTTGCAHEPCAPKKKRSAKVLLIATMLFIVNVGFYVFIHMPSDKERAGLEHAHHAHDHHDH